ncbi:MULTISPECIES: DUF4123 domain-containing protein [unclassified Janthinobacterium]|uniref:DUF4123 domain-containing protein n=1 Tax=unclassified Janthinobacterium TaxID=2610881 RepID=UPI0012F8F97A|nr:MULTISPECIES: DUF4123 domain-containing protein [unclassified Janthinobacterium]
MLVDYAGIPGLVKKLTQANLEWTSLFERSKEESALSVAPVLFQITMDERGIQHRILIDWVCEHGTYSSSMIFLVSPLPMPELARRLMTRLDAVLSEDIEVLLRFFDPRIFEQLMVVLSIKEKQEFLCIAHECWFPDRRGNLQKVRALFSEVDIYSSPMTLNSAQEDALLDASEQDQVAALLLSGIPESYLNLSLPKRSDFIVRHMEAAKLLGISSTHELALYCALPFFYGEDFSEEQQWKIVLEKVKLKMVDLKQAAEEVEKTIIEKG